MVFPPDDWLIPGLLTRQNTAIMIGPPKAACKSWLLLDAAISLSYGEAIWGLASTKPTRPMRTVYFSQEDTDKNAYDRVMAHVGAGRAPNNGLWVAPKDLNYVLDTGLGLGLIRRELNAVLERAGPIDLIMFDPMREIHNGDENDSQTIARMWKNIVALEEQYKAAVMIAHHITKPPRDRSTYDPADPFNARGSGAIYGSGDAFITVVPGEMAADESYRDVTAHFESKRAKQMPPANLRVTFGTGRVSHLGKGKGRSQLLNLAI